MERVPVPPAAAIRVLMWLTRLGGRRKPPSIRRLEIENLRYYHRGLTAGPRAVWTSLFSPSELLEAFGLAPLCLEGLAGMLAAAGAEQPFLARAAGEAVPNTLCTFHRVIAGLGTSAILPRPGLVLSASALCDGNAVSFRLLAGRRDVPFVFLDVPAEPTAAGVAYLVEQLKDLGSTLERLTGRPLDSARLSAAVARSRRAVTLARQLFARRCTVDRNLFRGHQMINMMLALNAMAGSAALCRILEALNRDAGDPARWCRDYASVRTAPSAVRLLWTHIAPLYDYNHVWAVLDDGGRAKVVGEECSHWDESALKAHDDIEFVARRLIGVPQNGPLEQRLLRIERLRREARADAVVHFSHWGCHQAAGAVPMMQRFFNERGVPFLNLSGDCVDSAGASREQHATRCEAFVEMVAGRR
jgi:benzoyl-CoA reductase/2-hydroxyglutaryl-CoA dehydratase subunit BcrC/BadD/HgdB